MFTQPLVRGKGFAYQNLLELEKWAQELGYKECILETGIKQPQAIALYLKCGYERIPNFGPYKNVIESVCFSKRLL